MSNTLSKPIRQSEFGYFQHSTMKPALLAALAACFLTLLLAMERGAYAWSNNDEEDEVEEDDDDDFDFVSSNVRTENRFVKLIPS